MKITEYIKFDLICVHVSMCTGKCMKHVYQNHNQSLSLDRTRNRVLAYALGLTIKDTKYYIMLFMYHEKFLRNLWCLCVKEAESYIILFFVKYPGLLWTLFIPGKLDYIYNDESSRK